MRANKVLIVISLVVALLIALNGCMSNNEIIDLKRPKIIYPANGATNVAVNTKFIWEDVSGGKSTVLYDVFIKDESTKQASVIENVTGNSTIVKLDYEKRYSWYVVAKDLKTGMQVNSNSGTFETENLPPATPELRSPPDGATNVDYKSVILEWYTTDPNASDIVSYDVYIGKDLSKVTPIVVDKLATSLEVKDLDASTTYYWKVVAKDGKQGITESTVSSFTTRPTIPPVIDLDSVYPKNGATGVEVELTLRWEANDPDGESLRYDIYFGDNPNPNLLVKDLSKNSYELNELIPGARYYWRIVAKDGKGGIADSGVIEFQTKSITTNVAISHPSPEDGATDIGTSVVLSWEASGTKRDGVKWLYNLYFGTSSNPPLVKSRLNSTSVSMEGLEYGRVYYWRVELLEEKDGEVVGRVEGPLWKFSTEKVNIEIQLLQPDFNEEITSTPIVLKWSGSDPNGGVLRYSLYLSPDEGLVTNNDPKALVVSNLTSTWYQIDDIDNGTYYWKVAAYNVAGLKGESEVRKFTVDIPLPPEQPHDPYPEDKARGIQVPVTLKWLSSDRDGSSVYYNVYFSSDYAKVNAMEESVKVASGIEENSFKLEGLKDGTTYYWRIVAIDSDGLKSVGPVWNFTTRKIVQIEGKPKIISTLYTGSFVNDLSVYGGYLFLIDREGKFYIVDVRDPAKPLQVGELTLGGYLSDIVVTMGYAYILDYENEKLYVVDVKVPTAPEIVKEISMGSKGYRMVESAGYLYVGSIGKPELTILDVSTDPSSPAIKAEYELDRPITGMAVLGSDLLTIDFYSGKLTIYDIDDISNVYEISNFSIEKGIYDITVSGNYAYISSYNTGKLIVLDVSDVNNVKVSKAVNVGGNPAGIFANDTYVFVTTYGSKEVVILDITVQEDPVVAYRLATLGKTVNVKVVRGYSYISAGLQGLVVAKVGEEENSNPFIYLLSPENEGTSAVLTVLRWVAGDFDNDPLSFDLYLSTDESSVASTLEETLIESATEVYRYETRLASHTTYYWRVVVKDSYGGSATSAVWSFTTVNSNPTITSMTPSGGTSGVSTEVTFEWTRSDIDGDELTYTLYISENEDMSASVVATVTAETKYSTELKAHTTYYWEVEADDGYGGVATSDVASFTTANSEPNVELVSPGDGEEGVATEVTFKWEGRDGDNDELSYTLYVAKNEDMTNAVVKDTEGATSYSMELDASATYYWKVEVKDGYGGVSTSTIWSFTTRKEVELSEVGNCSECGNVKSIMVVDDYAYGAADASGLVVIDVSSKDSPDLATDVTTTGYAKGVFVYNAYVYVAADDGGLDIFDVSEDPASPTKVGNMAASDSFLDVFVISAGASDMAYIAANASGLVIVDVTDKNSPALEKQLNTSGNAKKVYVSGDHVYIGNDNGILDIFNLSDNSSNSLNIASYEISGIFVDESNYYAYITTAESGKGFVIVDLSTSESTPVNISGGAYGINVYNGYAYVVTDKIVVVNVKDPNSPYIVNDSYDLSGMKYDIFVSNEYVYTTTSNGMTIIRIY